MSDYSAAIYGLIAFASVVTAGVVFVLAQPTDLPSVKKSKGWAWRHQFFHLPTWPHVRFLCCLLSVAWPSLWGRGWDAVTEPVSVRLILNFLMTKASLPKKSYLLFASVISTVVLFPVIPDCEWWFHGSINSDCHPPFCCSSCNRSAPGWTRWRVILRTIFWMVHS